MGQRRGGHSWACSVLDLLRPRPSGRLPPAPLPVSSDSGGREETRLCQAWCALSPGSLDGIGGAPTQPVEASRLGHRTHRGESEAQGGESHDQRWPPHTLPQPSTPAHSPRSGGFSSRIFASGGTVEGWPLDRRLTPCWLLWKPLCGVVSGGLEATLCLSQSRCLALGPLTPVA